MANITYNNKTQSLPYDAAKFNADDANQIKAVVNLKADISQIGTGIKGVAIPTTVPPVTPVDGDVWLVNSSNLDATYVGFGNTLVPSKVGDLYATNNRFLRVAGAWVLQRELIGIPAINTVANPYTSRAYLVNELSTYVIGSNAYIFQNILAGNTAIPALPLANGTIVNNWKVLGENNNTTLQSIQTELHKEGIIGAHVFTDQTTGSGATVGMCLINQRRFSDVTGLVKKIKIAGSGSTSVKTLVIFEKIGNEYVQKSATNFTVPAVTGAREIDLSSLNIAIDAGNTYGVSHVSGTGNVYAKLDVDSDWGYVTTTLTNGTYVIDANSVEGDNNTNTTFFFDLYVEGSVIPTLTKQVSDVKTTVTKNSTDIVTATSNIDSNTVKISSLITGVDYLQEQITVGVDTPLYTIAGENNVGWGATTFKGWAVGWKFSEAVGTFEKVRMYLMNVNTNHHIRAKLYRRPVANESNIGVATYPPMTGDVLIEEKVFPTTLYQNISTVQPCDFIFTSVPKSLDYVYLIIVTGELVDNTLGALGSDRTTVVPNTLKQFEVGYYYDTANKAVGLTTSGYRVSVQVLSVIKESKFDNFESQLIENTSNITLLQNSVPARTTNGTILYDETFTSISTNWINNGWVTVSGGISPTGVGLTNFIRLNKQYSLDKRNVRTVVRLGADTRLLIYTKQQEGSVSLGSMSECDVSAGKMRIYGAHNDSTTTLTAISTEANYTFLTDRDYIIEYGIDKNTFTHTLSVTDTITGVRTTITDITRLAGRQHDNYAITCYSGIVPIIKSFTLKTPYKNPFVWVGGDSITEAMGNGVLSADGYAQRLVSAVGGAVSGRGGGNINGLLRRIETEVLFLKPANVSIMIGTNSGNSLALLRQMITRLTNLGIVVYLNNIPTIANTSDYITRNTDIATVRSEFGLKGVLMDVATAINNNPASGQDNTKFYSDLVHPINFGQTFMFDRFRIDTPELFY